MVVFGVNMQKESIYCYNRWLHSAHLERFVVAAVLESFHVLLDVQKPFRTVATLKKEWFNAFNVGQTRNHGQWCPEDEVDWFS